jgi:hypothetical protein
MFVSELTNTGTDASHIPKLICFTFLVVGGVDMERSAAVRNGWKGGNELLLDIRVVAFGNTGEALGERI